VPVDVEVSNVAVQALAHMVGQPAHGQNISGPVERNPIVEIKTLVGQNLVGNRPQAGVIGLKAVPRRRKGYGAAHPLMIRDPSRSSTAWLRSMKRLLPRFQGRVEGKLWEKSLG